MINSENAMLPAEKRRYVRMSWPGAGVGACIVEPQNVDEMEGAGAGCVLEDVWMTEAEYEALPEFES